MILYLFNTIFLCNISGSVQGMNLGYIINCSYHNAGPVDTSPLTPVGAQ